MDSAWCPVCDKQIEPKRTTLLVPRATRTQPPPAPPSSPRKKGALRKAGLVNGTGRLLPNGTVKPPPPAPAMRKRTVIDQGPTPLYCSDECQLADLNRTRRGPPIDPHAEEPAVSSKQVFSTGASDSDASSADGGSPKRPMTSMERFNAFYGLPDLPAPLVFDDEVEQHPIPAPYNGGIIMASRLINSLVPPPAKQPVGRYRPAPEPRKPTPGWNDGSNLWRSAVYSFTAPSNSPFHADAVAKAYGSVVASPHRPHHRMSRASSSASIPEPVPAGRASSASEAMLSSFSENFAKRSQSRSSMYAGGGSATSPVPSSAASATSTHSLPLPSPKQRSLVPTGAEGKLLVPDVKMKVHSGSSASLSSHWSGPATSSTNSRSVRSPLSITSDSDEDTERCPSNLSTRNRPAAENTRSWSYENVKTYDIMPMIPKKVKKMEKRIVDGEEVEVEVEVEVYPERKRLFLFPPSQRISVP